LPQVPQFRASVWTSVQTALVPVPQTTSPAGQTQWPPVQVAPVAHGVSHAPQFSSSFCRFTQVDPHVSGSPAGQPHRPFTQTSLVNGQSLPQTPQLAGSVSVATHVKLLLPTTGQGTRGATHWQTPDAHAA